MAVKRTNSPSFAGYLQSMSATLNPAGDFAASMWVRFAGLTTAGFWSCGDGSDMFILTTDVSDRLILRQGTSPTTRLTSPSAIAVAVWYFVALTKSGATISLYLGDEASTAVQIASANSSGWGTLFVAGGQRIFGARGEGDQTPTNTEMALVRSWDGAALDLSQLNAERASAAPVVTANLRSDWRLTNAAGRAADSSGNGFSLTDGAGTTWADGVGPTLPGASAAGVNTRRSGYLGGRLGGSTFGQGW